VKYDPEGRGASTGTEENSGQALFYRPASSGQYAVTVHVELERVGKNDITGVVDIDEDERHRRQKALLRSLIHTFVLPKGAQRNTQSPHVVAFEGVITSSTSSIPAPAISALQGNYKEQVKGIVARLVELAPGAVTVQEFARMEDFAANMNALVARVGSSSGA
jgi:CRISPR-associated protein Cst2